MSKPLTVKQLLKLCQEEIAKGNGDCSIMISSDDEGNDYHYLWYAFTPAKDLLIDDEIGVLDYSVDESVAPIDKTIILG